MFDPDFVDCDYGSGNRTRSASIPDAMRDVEPRGSPSLGGGWFQSGLSHACYRMDGCCRYVTTKRPMASSAEHTPALSMTCPDPRSQLQMITGHEYSAPTSFDDVIPDRFGLIATIPRFSRTAEGCDLNSCFESIAQYAWDGNFVRGILVAALSWIV